jgi:hypothetical protein
VPGGKHYLARRVVGLMPPHLHCVELFGCGLQVFFAKDPEGTSEVVNDLNREWTRHTFDVANHAAGGSAKRRMTEVVWANF